MATESKGPIKITLTPKQIDYADNIGRGRRETAIDNGRKQRANASTEPEIAMSRDLQGARGEAACYIWLSPVIWDKQLVRGKMPATKKPDFDNFIDIKTATESHHGLIVLQGDNENWAYVLVLANEHPTYSIAGWLWGHECKQDKYLKEITPGRGKTYLIPQRDVVRSPQSLIEELRRRQNDRLALRKSAA